MTDVLGRQAAPVQQTRREKLLLIFFAVMLIASTVLQKIGVVMPLTMPLIFAGIGALGIMGVLEINPVRLGLYGLFVATVLVSQLASHAVVSPSALSLLLIIYVPLIFEYRVSEATYLRMMGMFVNIMLGASAIVLAQQIAQHTVGARVWPDLNKLPSVLLVQGFNYWRETGYGTNKFLPNGVFFLEPSVLAQFLSLALVVELSCFGRLWRSAALLVAGLLTQSGTGLIILAFCAPFLVMRLPVWAIVTICIALVLGVGVMVFSKVGVHMFERMSEFGQPGTSGYIRYTDPITRALAQLKNPTSIFTGLGAGSASHDYANQGELTTTKLILEYGLLATFSFYAFFLYGLFAGCYRSIIAYALLVYDTIGGGGLTVPIYVLTVALFGTLFRVEGGSLATSMRMAWPAPRPKSTGPGLPSPDGA